MHARRGGRVAFTPSGDAFGGENLHERRLRVVARAGRAGVIDAIPEAGPAGRRADGRHLHEHVHAGRSWRRADDECFDAGDLQWLVFLREQSRGGRESRRELYQVPSSHTFSFRTNSRNSTNAIGCMNPIMMKMAL